MHDEADDQVPATLDALGWTALVAGWVELARASRSVPPSHTQLRESIAPLITLEANAAALGQLAQVIAAQRPHARAMAELSIRNATQTLRELWAHQTCPSEFLDACTTAQVALRMALYAGLEELVVMDSNCNDAVVVPDLGLDFDRDDASTHRGTLACMAPGSLAMPGEPIAWWCERNAPTFALPQSFVAQLATARGDTAATTLQRRPAAHPRQVYRTLDSHGFFLEAVIVPVHAPSPPRALPMLIPLLLDGAAIGRFLHSAEESTRMQRIALNGANILPIRVE